MDPAYFFCLLVSLAIAIFLIFLEELKKMVSALCRVPGVALLLPLSLLSWMVLKSVLWLFCAVNVVWVGEAWFAHFLQRYHGSGSSWMGQIFLTTCVVGIALLPTQIAWLLAKPFRPFAPPYWSSVWLCLGLVVVTTASLAG